MTDRTCEKCNKVFDLPCRLKIHQSRKTSCGLLNEIIDNKKIKCKHCLRLFTTNSAMYRHIQKNCKMVNCLNKDSLLLAINSSNLVIVQKQIEIQNQQIKELTNVVKNLKKKIPLQII